MRLYATCPKCNAVGVFTGGKYKCRECYHIWAPPRKYRNVRTQVDGLQFDSKWEAERWQALSLLRSAGVISHLRRQVSYDLHVNDTKVGRYVADFVYVENGDEVVEDAKGKETPLFRWKARHFEAEYGHPIRITHR